MSGSAENTLWARAFIDELARAGLREVVIAPGSRSTPLVMAAAADDRVRVRVHLDERSCGFFALGVGKATGRPAAVITTSGTAVANLYPAVVEASQAGVPLLVLTADRPPRLRGADANQAIDQVGIFASYPRAFFEMSPPLLEDRALRHLRSVAGRSWDASVGIAAGPVHVNFPFDKPLEPADPDPSFTSEHAIAASGRPDGNPWVRIDEGVPTAPDGLLDEIADELAGRSGVLVAGPSEDADRTAPAVRRFAEASGFALLADPLSRARFGFDDGALAVAGYDLFLRDDGIRDRLRPEVIVRIGASPTSAALQRFLFACDDLPQVVIDSGPRWKDHGTTATSYLRSDPVDTLSRLSDRLAARSGPVAEGWTRAHAASVDVLEALGPADLGEGGVARSVIAGLPDGASLFVSSSMPVRDLDAFTTPDRKLVRILANRGASGIDGVVSSAFGAASTSPAPTALLIGDVAFFHDQNGLLWSREDDGALVIVLVDNDGGAIFGMLPISGHEPAFTEYFTTPHGIDPSHAAAAHGLDYRLIPVEEVKSQVAAAAAAGETVLLHVRTDGGEGHRLRASVLERTVRSVREQLG